MSNAWLKRLSGISAIALVAGLVVLAGCDCDDCDRPKQDCCEGEWRSTKSPAHASSVDSSSAWQTEEQYWRTNYSSRPYVTSGVSYDDYAPAYRYGYDTRRRYHGQRFDDVEKDLARDWSHMRQNSKLTWEQAKPAIRDSWDRGDARVNVRTDRDGASINVGTRPSWESDEQYWRSNYSSRPYYTQDYTYDDYSPAYRYGYESRVKYQGKRFDDVEADLSRGWESTKAHSKLGWEKAKAATRDAWDRIDRTFTGDSR